MKLQKSVSKAKKQTWRSYLTEPEESLLERCSLFLSPDMGEWEEALRMRSGVFVPGHKTEYKQGCKTGVNEKN